MKKRVVFGITSLNIGGAERVLVDLANKLCNKYDITIFTLYDNGEFEKELSSEVRIKSMYSKQYKDLSFLEKKRVSLRLFDKGLRSKLYEEYIKGDYDVEIAFLEGPITWLFSTPSDTRKIAWIHSDIESIFGNSTMSQMKQRMNRKLYSNFDNIIFVSNDNMKKFMEYFPDNKVDKQVIYNYIDSSKVIEKADSEKVTEIDDDVISFVQVSRLVDAKAIPRLIDVHKKLIDEGYEHKIYVVGDGPLKESLANKIKSCNIEETFVLLGQKSNPYPYIKKGNYFILPSQYEGYGMVLLEAMALNKYIMITDTAAREAIADYENKMIVDNSFDGVYEGLKTIIEKKIECSNKNSTHDSNVIEQVENVIEGVHI